MLGIDVDGAISGMYIIDGSCHLFVKENKDVRWYKFDDSVQFMNYLIGSKRDAGGDWSFVPPLVNLEYPISPTNGWTLRFANRDLTEESTMRIVDAFFVKCYDPDTLSPLLYFSQYDCYITSGDLDVVDMAYEQTNDNMYVMFANDKHVYKYDNLYALKDSRNRILLRKDDAAQKIETMHSVAITTKGMLNNYLYLDYFDVGSEDNKELKWELKLYGKVRLADGWKVDVETWPLVGGTGTSFKQYNTIMFGNTLFNSSQLAFQNISRNKEMFEILDINEVDGRYYGLFRDDSQRTKDKNFGR